MISRSHSGPSRAATCSTRPIKRLMPRLVLAAQTIGTCRAASRTALSAAPCSPVVPITTGLPSPAASAACPAVASGVVNCELDRDVAAAQQLLRVVGGADAGPADT